MGPTLIFLHLFLPLLPAATDIPITQESFHCQIDWSCQENAEIKGVLEINEVIKTQQGVFTSEKCRQALNTKFHSLQNTLQKQKLCQTATETNYSEQPFKEGSLLLDCDPLTAKQVGAGSQLCQNIDQLENRTNVAVFDKQTFIMHLGFITEAYNKIATPFLFEYSTRRYLLSEHIAEQAYKTQENICQRQPIKIKNIESILPGNQSLYRERLSQVLELLRSLVSYSKNRFQWKGEISPVNCKAFIQQNLFNALFFDYSNL